MRRRHFITSLLAGAAIVLSSAGAAHADFGDQLFKLFADDGAENDLFGFSVGISGSIAIAGARADDDNGPRSGSAYLFDVTDPSNPVQIAKLLADDGSIDHEFGEFVAIGGATAIVGTIHDDDNGMFSGAAYLFEVPTGRQIAKLLPDDGAELDFFGASVAVSGATAIVGAYWDDDNGTDSGSAYLFDATTGKQIAKLLAGDGADQDQFGFSVAISGTTAIVGARDDSNPNGFEAGAAYLFDVTDPSNPVQIAKLLPDDGAQDDLFGWSVAISGATAIVGSIHDDDNADRAGSAYLFDTTTGDQLFKLLADNGGFLDEFGFSVAISGNTAIVGAPEPFGGTGSGKAYLFDVTTGRQIASLEKDDDDKLTLAFGQSVGISGGAGNETAIVGVEEDDELDERAGAAYLFDAGTAAGKCLWDLDDSGGVGTGDLILLVGSWGHPYGAADLIELLGNWGPCP